jgi:predicted NUDIX family phosphoesterase
MIEAFLKTCGWKVHVMKERASECPLPMKGHFFFNTWTTGTMLAGLLDAVDRDYDLVILDRGLFDALIWLQMQKEVGQVSASEFSIFTEFVNLPRWRLLEDSVALIVTEPARAMQRENEKRLIRRSGSVMNEKFLSRFNETVSGLSGDTPFPVKTFANDGEAKDGSLSLLRHIISEAKTSCDKEIAVISREQAHALVPDKARVWGDEAWLELPSLVQYRLRSEVESNDEFVQLLACGAQTSGGRVFLTTRRQSRNETRQKRAGSALIWRGCHLTKASGDFSLSEIKQQLVKRLTEELHLSELNVDPQPRGFVWCPDEDDRRHLGLVFEVPIEQAVADSLEEKEFRTNGHGHHMTSSFIEPTKLQQDEVSARKLESWSKLMLREGWL